MSIHPTAMIHPTAQVDPSCEIGPMASIGADVILGPECVVMQGAIIRDRVRAGRKNFFHYNCVVGHDPQFLGFDPETKSGVVIGDENHFREFCQIHRGLKNGTDTIIGNGNFFMATSHIAHDCVVGSHNVVGTFAGLAGHCVLGNRAFISPVVGVHQYVRIGDLAIVGGVSAAPQDVPPYCMVKNYGEIVGLNTVGLRRNGVGAETRTALKKVYRMLFRSGMPLRTALAAARAVFDPATIPPEVDRLLAFCEAPSRRGILTGPKKQATGSGESDDDDE